MPGRDELDPGIRPNRCRLSQDSAFLPCVFLGNNSRMARMESQNLVSIYPQFHWGIFRLPGNIQKARPRR